MPRRIITAEFQVGEKGTQVDGYFDRVLKYIPADIVAGWVAVTNVIKSQAKDDPASGTILWAAFAFGLIVTGIWTARQTKTPSLPPWRLQIIMSIAAFAVWVFALGGPFATLPFYREYYGSLLLIAFTMLSGIAVPK